MQDVRKKAILVFNAYLERRERSVVAYCQQFPVGGIGKTQIRALIQLLECLEVYLEIANRDGTLYQLLIDQGMEDIDPDRLIDGEFELTVEFPQTAAKAQRVAVKSR